MMEINNIEWLVGSEETLNERPVIPFDEHVIDEGSGISSIP